MTTPNAHQLLSSRLLHAIAMGGLVVGCGSQTDDSGKDRNAQQQNEPPQNGDDDASGDDASGDDSPGDDSSGGAGGEPLPGSAGAMTSPEGPSCEFGNPAQFCLDRASMERLGKNGTGQIPLDPPRSDAEVALAFEENGCMRFDWVATGCCNPALGPGEPNGEGLCCYLACEGACCGRPFVVEGQALVAPTAARDDWSAPVALLTVLPAAAKKALGQAWLEDAQMEHASIASFARFALELCALGAPAELLAAVQRAGLDEVEHARACFGVAKALSGQALGPGKLPAPHFEARGAFDVLRAAVHEGCVGETLAAGLARAQAERATNPALAALLRRIADDELRHAELAYQFVAWMIRTHGDAARAVVAPAFREALQRPPLPPSTPALDAELLHEGGRLTPEEWQTTARSLLREVVEPTAQTLVLARAA